jgi:UDP-N-acetylmuramate dehydrogenase
MNSIHENVSLKSLNTFRLDVSARYLAEPDSPVAVQELLKSRLAAIRPFMVLGGGSNVLFTGDFPGIVVHPRIRGIWINRHEGNTVWVKAGAGENWDSFVAWCVNRNLGGIENLSLIPGTVGACPIQNIGAYGVEVSSVVEKVEAVWLEDGRTFSLKGTDCDFGYRNSVFKKELKHKALITHVEFRLTTQPELHIGYADLQKELSQRTGVGILTVREAVIRIRKSKLPDPDETGNAGSFFKNPILSEEQAGDLRARYPNLPVYPETGGMVKLSAAWLIDQCGWKGKRRGDAGTHDKQALILVNHGEASGKEILHFAQAIQASVHTRFGIELEMEVNVVEGSVQQDRIASAGLPV